jgi:hypothetical protein
MTRNTLTRDQQTRFLRAVLTLDQPVARIVKQLHLEPQTVVRWLHQRGFCKRLRAVRRYLHRTRELHVEIAALHASAKLISQGKAGELGQASKSLLELVRLARRLEKRHPSKDADKDGSRAGTHPDASDPATPIYHPDVAADEAERLIRELEADGENRSPHLDTPVSHRTRTRQ